MTTQALSKKRLFWVLLLCSLLTGIIVLVTPLIGYVPAPGGGVALDWLDLGRALSGGPDSRDPMAQIFFLSRLPRTLTGVLAGAGLAAAGVTLQALLRNPLAEPYTVGLSSGASLGAVLAIRFGVDSVLGSSGVAVFSFLGAALVMILVWRLARVGKSLPPATLLLAGVTLAFFCSSASMLVQYTASFSENFRIVRWLMGGLDWIRYADLLRAAVLVAIGVVALLTLSRDLNALSAGPDAAASVGVNVDRSMLVAYAAASLIVGAVVATAGPIGFVGLIVPHILRGLIGPDHRLLMPASMICGAGFVVSCDTLARTIIEPQQLPVGVVTALLGAPFFLFLLVREKGRAGLWG